MLKKNIMFSVFLLSLSFYRTNLQIILRWSGPLCCVEGQNALVRRSRFQRHSQPHLEHRCEGIALSLLCLRPLSTDSCFLTKPTQLRADPVIMRLCPEPRAAGERCQQLGADLLNGPCPPPRVQREQKLLLTIVGGEQISPRGDSPCAKLKLSICVAVASRAYASTH